jgi:maltooligosyltrehalose synthase
VSQAIPIEALFAAFLLAGALIGYLLGLHEKRNGHPSSAERIVMYEVEAIREALRHTSLELDPEQEVEIAVKVVASLHEQQFRQTSDGTSFDD